MSRADVLVDADWVQAHLGDPAVVLVEVDDHPTAYGKRHVPDTVTLDWKKDLRDPVKRDLVDRAGFKALLADRGIASDDTVILYGGSRRSAAYAYWCFKACGHRDVRLLDVGRRKWEPGPRMLATDARYRPPAAHRPREVPAPRAFPQPKPPAREVWTPALTPVHLIFRAMSACASTLLAAQPARRVRHARSYRAMALTTEPGQRRDLGDTSAGMWLCSQQISTAPGPLSRTAVASSGSCPLAKSAVISTPSRSDSPR